MKSNISLIILLIFFVSFTMSFSHAAEYIRDEDPAPESVEEIEDPLSEIFRVKPIRKLLFPFIKDRIKELPPFFSDSHIGLNLRNFYFYRKNPDDSESVAWAQGGSLFYESGLIKDIFSVGAEIFTSQKLYGPEDKGGSFLLKPVQEGFTVLGRAYAKLNYEDKVSVSLYRQYYNLPYVNKQFNRMVPRTFEGYSVTGDLGSLQFILGYISKMKRRNADKFINMSKAAGVSEVDNGLFMGGMLFSIKDKFSVGAINYVVEDVINIFYSESQFTHTSKKDIGFKISAQITDQRSVGDDLLTGSSFSTQVLSSLLSLSYQYTVLGFAFSTTSSDRRIISPYGGYPGYISLMVKDFNRAGEEAFMLALSYSFNRFGLEELSFFTKYAFGYDAVDPDSGESLPDQKEFNITFDYRPKILDRRDLWLRIRFANVDIDGENDSLNDFRLILNYSFTIL